jgi:oligo-1,6-glucosidase
MEWWKKGVMYQIYPRSFQDSNGDGIGDIQGIISRLNYIQSLGVDIVWLGPIYESPNDDNGYDISNYYQIHPEFGTMEDFDELLTGMHERGIKLIMDLVVNHTSDEHRWFKESRKSKDNPYRDYYFWRKGKNGGPPNNWKAFFGGSAWEYDETTDEYYLHIFTKKQPDLNWDNPSVREEIYKMMRYWLDKGVDGFRMDVISLISKRTAFEESPEDNLMHMVYQYYANGPHIHNYLQEMYDQVLSTYDIMTVGEGPGITAEVALDYVGASRKELNMLFQLDLMFIDNGPRGKFDYKPIDLRTFKKIFRDWDQAMGKEGWNNLFLDNHDFPRMVSRYGNDQEYRNESAKMLILFLLTMRGTPCFYMGGEIGMTNPQFFDPNDYRDIETVHYLEAILQSGGDLDHALAMVHIQSRDNVRTPFQWNNKQNAGFSEGNPWIKVNDNYPDINVLEAEKDPHSILHFFRKCIEFRKSEPIFTEGDFEDLLPEDPHIFIYKRENEKSNVIVCLNFSDHFLPYPEVLKDKKLIFSNYLEMDNQLKPWEGSVFE